MVLCTDDYVGDPRIARSVKWTRMVTSEDVPAVLYNSQFYEPILPSCQEDRVNPLYVKSAQEWFNQLPDDTAKAIVNLRRSTLHHHMSQAMPLGRPVRPAGPPPAQVLAAVAARDKARQAHGFYKMGVSMADRFGAGGGQLMAGTTPGAYPDPAQPLLQQQQQQQQAQEQQQQGLLRGLCKPKPKDVVQPGVLGAPPGSAYGGYGGYGTAAGTAAMQPLPVPGQPLPPPGMDPIAAAAAAAAGQMPPGAAPGAAGAPPASQEPPEDGGYPGLEPEGPQPWYEQANLFQGFNFKWNKIDYPNGEPPRPDQQQAGQQQLQRGPDGMALALAAQASGVPQAGIMPGMSVPFRAGPMPPPLAPGQPGAQAPYYPQQPGYGIAPQGGYAPAPPQQQQQQFQQQQPGTAAGGNNYFYPPPGPPQPPPPHLLQPPPQQQPYAPYAPYPQPWQQQPQPWQQQPQPWQQQQQQAPYGQQYPQQGGPYPGPYGPPQQQQQYPGGGGSSQQQWQQWQQQPYAGGQQQYPAASGGGYARPGGAPAPAREEFGLGKELDPSPTRGGGGGLQADIRDMERQQQRQQQQRAPGPMLKVDRSPDSGFGLDSETKIGGTSTPPPPGLRTPTLKGSTAPKPSASFGLAGELDGNDNNGFNRNNGLEPPPTLRKGLPAVSAQQQGQLPPPATRSGGAGGGSHGLFAELGGADDDDVPSAAALKARAAAAGSAASAAPGGGSGRLGGALAAPSGGSFSSSSKPAPLRGTGGASGGGFGLDDELSAPPAAAQPALSRVSAAAAGGSKAVASRAASPARGGGDDFGLGSELGASTKASTRDSSPAPMRPASALKSTASTASSAFKSTTSTASSAPRSTVPLPKPAASGSSKSSGGGFGLEDELDGDIEF